MKHLFDHYRENTAQSAPLKLSAAVMSRLHLTQIAMPSLSLVLSSTIGLAAAIAFGITFLSSDDEIQPPSTASLFGATGAGMLADRP